LALKAWAWPTILLMCDMLQHDRSMLSAAACSSSPHYNIFSQCSKRTLRFMSH
jgi:hypothetical protein